MDRTVSESSFAGGETLIRSAVCRFALPESGRVLVGASGGKDSTFLALLLKRLGFEVQCLVVDLRYPHFEAGRIRDNLLGLGLNAEVCDLRAALLVDSFSQPDRHVLTTNFRELDSDTCVTPCGACSRNKRIALTDYAIREGIRFIALGHHREDFLATILKDYFVRRYYTAYGEYDSARFQGFLRECPINESDLAGLCAAGEAATMAVSLPLPHGVTLIRPMIFVPEHDIIVARDSLPLPVFSSGCSHSVFSSPQAQPTKRELVHVELTRRIEADSHLPGRLLPFMLSTLSQKGLPLSNPRNHRAVSLPGFVR